MDVPADLKYTKSDEWFRVDGDVVTIGISDYAQDQLNDIVYVEFKDSDEIFESLLKAGVVIRNRASEVANCLRITVGTMEENQVLMNALKKIENEKSIVSR